MSRPLTFRFSIGLATGAVLGGFGCADPVDSMDRLQRAGGGRQLRLANVPVDRAFEAGTYAMQQWFRGVDPRPSGGLIRGLATEYTQSGGTERIRDVIGFPNRMRRRGTLSIQPLGDGCRLICRVDRERLDTSDHRIFRQQRSINDLPNQTPIERDAGLTASQEQAWTSLPRDRALEQDILDLIRSRTADSSPEENPDGA